MTLDDLHETPAQVIRISDNRLYPVYSVHYDGDKKGLAVIIEEAIPIILFPGEYRTHSLYYWQKEIRELSIQILS